MNPVLIEMKTFCLRRIGWVLLVLALAPASAQNSTTGSIADPQIAAALKQISAEKIRANIDKLVSFQTRSTLSAQDQASIAAGRGIGAAREWIKSEFELYSRDCNGCLEVKTDSFTEGPADRIRGEWGRPRAGTGRQESRSLMFLYTCPSCGAPAYSSANVSTVGSCPRCSKPLALATAEPNLTPKPIRGARR